MREATAVLTILCIEADGPGTGEPRRRRRLALHYGAVTCDQVLDHGLALRLVGGGIDAHTIGAALLERVELEGGCQGFRHARSLADIEHFVGCPAVILVAEEALRHEVDGAQGAEPGAERPRLEAVLM